MEAAIVAFHGATSDPGLDAYVADLQGAIGDRWGDGFVPRPIRGVHSTLIGLDSLGPWDGPDDLRSDHDRAVRARRAITDVDGWDAWPLTLQLGGFPDEDLAITSRGHRLHERSLAVHGRQVVLLGWPVDADGPTAALTTIRRDLGRHGVVHRYPLDGEHGDPDAHLVVGELDEPVDPVRVDDLLVWGRDFLVGHGHHVALDPSALSVVVYTDPRLPEDSTLEVAWSDLL